jgi:hypothetical protein
VTSLFSIFSVYQPSTFNSFIVYLLLNRSFGPPESRYNPRTIRASCPVLSFFVIYSLSKVSQMMSQTRGATGIYFFGIYFLQRIYLFTEDLLGFISCINISAHPHPCPWTPRLPSPSLSLRPYYLFSLTLRNYTGFISKCMRNY